MNVVLYQPEIPSNTGNIIRTCVCTDSVLHMIRPFGFSMEDRFIKRAGMDYFEFAKIKYYDSFEEYFEKNKDEQIFYFTTKSNISFTDVQYSKNAHLMFGPESRGLPEYVRNIDKSHCVRIPMLENEHVRCLNLANSVNIGLYEALRQTGFEFFK